MTRRLLLALLALGLVQFASPASAADWIHWRGPLQSGQSLEKGIPNSFDPETKENVIWTAPFGGRSAPLVMDGRVYVLQGYGEGLSEAERIVCVDEKTGKKLWEHVERVYLTDIVTNRLGWTSLTADPALKYVYAHTTAGNLVCLNQEGKVVWQRHLAEEFGRVSGYGGRIVSPICDSGLVIVGMLNSSWGDHARGANRFLAFDSKTGNVVWINDTGLPLRVTYQSNPTVAVINGQRLLIAGGSDGALHAFKVRTGERVWSYMFSGGAVNPSPVVVGNYVYCAHGEENPGGGTIGRVICVDASQIDPTTKTPKLVWEYQRAQRFGLASPAVADGVMYMPEDSGDLFAFDAKTGKFLWKYRYAAEVRGAPLIVDGHLWIFDVKGKLHVLKLNGKKLPDSDETFEYRFRETVNGLPVQTETNGTPIAVNGRVYFTSRTDLYCIGDAKKKPAPVVYPKEPEETPYKENAIAGARLYPHEVTVKPGETVKFQVVFFDENGREVKSNLPDPKAEWTIVTPDKTPTGAQPPPLAGKLSGDTGEGTLVLAMNPSQQGYVQFKMGPYTARGRVRVAPQIPFKADFEKAPAGSSPAGWVNTNGKFIVKQLPDGNLALMKTNDSARPPIARANAYITVPSATDYTIQADIMGTVVRGKLPDAGVVNCRYSLVFDGKIDPDLQKHTIRLTSWEARPRINVAVPFDWQPGQWYTAKLSVVHTEKGAELRGKVWKKGDNEPADWTIKFDDPHPTREGSAGLYGYISNVVGDDEGKILPGSELYFDNISITPHEKKK